MDEVQGMTRDDIIAMAREAGFDVEAIEGTEEVLERGADSDYYTRHPNIGYMVQTHTVERFAALVAQHTLSNIDPSSFMSYQEGFEAGAAAEREACAKVCENTDFDSDADFYRPDFAAAIRARGETK